MPVHWEMTCATESASTSGCTSVRSPRAAASRARASFTPFIAASRAAPSGAAASAFCDS